MPLMNPRILPDWPKAKNKGLTAEHDIKDELNGTELE
jgi:hypothetical protein